MVFSFFVSMQHQPSHSYADDPLVRRIIEDNLDERRGDLSIEERHSCIIEVSRRLDADIVRIFMSGEYSSELVQARIAQEIDDVLNPGDAAA